MKQLNHYETLDKMQGVINSKLYLFLCNLSFENTSLILRSADIFGVEKVIYFGNKTFDAKKLKKNARNSKIEIEYFNENFLDKIKQDGFSVFALEITDTSKPLKDLEFADKTCLVVGNEQHGIPQNILDKCDKSYHIEMVGENISSLNVSIATSIALYKFVEKNL